MHDVHCKACGSLLYSVVRENAWVHVAMGTLADAPSISLLGESGTAVSIAIPMPAAVEDGDG